MHEEDKVVRAVEVRRVDRRVQVHAVVGELCLHAELDRVGELLVERVEHARDAGTATPDWLKPPLRNPRLKSP